MIESDKNKIDKRFSWGTISYYAQLCIITLISRLPFAVLYFIADCLYYPFYYIVRYRRKIVRDNLTSSFPSKSTNEIIQIEKKFYRYFLDMVFETCKLASITKEEAMRRMKCTDAVAANSLLEQGHSVSSYLGHYANWEWISTVGLWLHESATVAQIYHPLSNKSLDIIMKRMRERMGNHCVEMHKTARYILNGTKDDHPYIIGFIADQSPSKDQLPFVPFITFLNHTVPVNIGTEKLTKRYDYKAVFIGVKRVKRGYYECRFSLLHNDPKSLPDNELTRLYFERLEQEIMEQPELYLWTHRRFKFAQPIVEAKA